ncbi:MAG TPA: MarR family transcriptional regulator [Armatimonadota bacterium]|jgi:DNA-binding MarR family transcriptional regulator
MQQDMARQCAGQVIETIPLVMRNLVEEMRRQSMSELTMPQFRALKIISIHQGASLSEVAEHIAVTLSSASRLVDGLVERQYLSRVNDIADRRRILLTLTAKGTDILERAHQGALATFARYLSALSDDDCANLLQAMDVMRGLLTIRPEGL